MENKKLIYYGIALYFIVDSIQLLLMKIIDTLTFHLEINFIINLSIKFFLYILLLILVFRSLKNIRVIKPWLLILIILSRFIPHQALQSDSASDTYIYFKREQERDDLEIHTPVLGYHSGHEPLNVTRRDLSVYKKVINGGINESL